VTSPNRKYRAVATTRFGGVRLIKRTKKGFSWNGSPKNSSIFMTIDEVNAAHKWANRQKAKTFRILRPGQYSHLRLDPSTKWPLDKKLLRRLNAVGRKINRIVYIKSGHRTLAEQTAFWNHFQKYGYPRAAYPNSRAPHIRGVAADCGVLDRKGNYSSLGLNPAAKKAAEALGLRAWVAQEPWHWARAETY
jgi:hypothetical protein